MEETPTTTINESFANYNTKLVINFIIARI